MKCYATPRSSGGSKELRCANGDLESDWDGCVDEESVRIQCPKDTYPCNGLRGTAEYPEFMCNEGCATSDRAMQCQGIMWHINIFVYIKIRN